MAAWAAAASISAIDAACAQGRTQDQKPATRSLTLARPTVASVSRQAQAEIRACPDSAALQCVADALTRYAAALQAVSH
jgi:hypothetical protein